MKPRELKDRFWESGWGYTLLAFIISAAIVIPVILFGPFSPANTPAYDPEPVQTVDYANLFTQPLSSLTIDELQSLADYCMEQANRYKYGNVAMNTNLTLWASRAVVYQTQILIATNSTGRRNTHYEDS